MLRDRLIQLETRLLASEYNGHRLLTMQTRNEDPGLAAMVMKLFTTLHAEWSGIITDVGAENATLVEYGQMLFVITPD